MNQSSERRIQKLDAVTIARIAAGEVVNRPSNALKELIENALDAGCSSVQITLRDGGLSLLQVVDDGTGIAQPDLDLLCERHATSKLNDAIDLPTVSTFGFRGEALASVCAIAKRVTVVTRTAESRCAFRAEYSESGKLVNCVQQAAAQRSGTCISVEQLFERTPNRARMFESSGSKRLADSEFAHCFETVLRFAMHFPNVSFALRKTFASGSGPGSSASAGRHSDEVALQTNATPNTTIRDVAMRLFGTQFAAQLTEFECASTGDDQVCGFQFRCLMTAPNANANTNASSVSASPNNSQTSISASPGSANKIVNAVLRRPFFSFSINDRLVESYSALRNAFRSAFAECASRLSGRAGAPKQGAMFVVGTLSLTDRTLVDANVHPTKAEVRISVHEQALLAAIDTALRNQIGCAPICDLPSVQLTASASLRDTKVQASQRSSQSAQEERDEPEREQRKRDAPSVMVRTDSKSRKMDEYLIASSSKTGSDCWQQTTTALTKELPYDTIGHSTVPKRCREVRLRRLVELRDEVRATSNSELTAVLRDAVFVGVCDAERCVLQSGVRLLLANARRLSKEFFFQRVLTRFANLDLVQFSSPIRVDALLGLAFDFDMATLGVDATAEASDVCERRTTFVQRGIATLQRHAEMLFDYFSVLLTYTNGLVPRRNAATNQEPDDTLWLAGLPSVLDDARFVPDANRLPVFLKQLVQNVVWTDEKQCYRAVCAALADLCCCKTAPAPSTAGTDSDRLRSSDNRNDDADEDAVTDEYRELVEHVLFAALKQATVDGQFLVPNAFHNDHVFVELASLPNLYRVFERC